MHVPYIFYYFYYNQQITNQEVIIKHWKEIGEITYYSRYIDDIIIIFDQNKINEVSITKYVNNIHNYLEFKLTEEEENKDINYLDLSIHRNNNSLQLGIYRKPTQTLLYISHPTIHSNINSQHITST